MMVFYIYKENIMIYLLLFIYPKIYVYFLSECICLKINPINII